MSPDVSPEQLTGVAKIDIDKTIDTAYAIGHTGNPLSDYPMRIRGLIQKPTSQQQQSSLPNH